MLSSSGTLLGRTLWFGRIALYGDHLQLTGWRVFERVRKRIPLAKIPMVEVWSVRKGPNVLVRGRDGERLSCRVESGVGLWHGTLKGDTDVEVQARS